MIGLSSYEAALACCRPPKFQRAPAFRREASTADRINIEGCDGPQPDAA